MYTLFIIYKVFLICRVPGDLIHTWSKLAVTFEKRNFYSAFVETGGGGADNGREVEKEEDQNTLCFEFGTDTQARIWHF